MILHIKADFYRTDSYWPAVTFYPIVGNINKYCDKKKTIKEVFIKFINDQLKTKAQNKSVNYRTAFSYYQKGLDIWIKTKDFKKASFWYKKALAEDPNYAPALSSLGYIMAVFENKSEEGKIMIKKAMELDPSWAYAP